MNKLNKLALLGITLGNLLTFVSCEKSPEKITPDPNAEMESTCLHSVTVDNHSYIDLFADLNVKNTSISNALVHDRASYIYTHKDCIYVVEENKDRVFKYKKENGALKKDGSTIILPSGSHANAIAFLDDTKAYLTAAVTGKVHIFNPQTMTLGKEIDLSAYAVGKEKGDKSPEPMACIIRDGLLYVTLWQTAGEMNPYDEGAYVLLIDTKTDKPVKMISDTRATMAGNDGPVGDPFVDEKGDLYFYCNGVFGYEGLKEGFLRIKKGSTDFDPDYSFTIKGLNINGIKNNMANFIYSKVYTENGKLYGFINVPGNAGPAPDYNKDRTFQPCEIDVYNKTVKVLNLAPTNGWSASVGKYDNFIVFGMNTEKEGTGYYLYDYKANKLLGKKIATQGAPFFFIKF